MRRDEEEDEWPARDVPAAGSRRARRGAAELGPPRPPPRRPRGASGGPASGAMPSIPPRRALSLRVTAATP